MNPTSKQISDTLRPPFRINSRAASRRRRINHSRGESVLHFLKSRLNVDSCGRYNWRSLPSIYRSCNYFEEFQYVDFPRVRKVEDRSIQVLARIKQHIYAFDHFQFAITPLSAGCSNRSKVSWIRTDLRYRGGWTAACTGLFHLAWPLWVLHPGPDDCKNTQEFGGKHQEYGFELFPVPCLLGHLYTEVLADKGAITFMQPGGFSSFINDHSPEYM